MHVCMYNFISRSLKGLNLNCHRVSYERLLSLSSSPERTHFLRRRIFKPPETTTAAVVPSYTLSTTSIKRIPKSRRGSLRLSFKSLLLLKAKVPWQNPLYIYQMESITKWDLGSLRTYYSVEPSEKFQKDKFLDISLVPCLQAELWKAQLRIKELEAEKFGSEENVRCFIRNQRNEREEITDPFVDYLKEKLSKEREEMKRTKAENSRLKKKILVMESSVHRLRRERDTMEKVCEELVTRIDELKANVRRMWDETEEERQMLQMAEMWREERVRVKFTEAKLALQEKYEEMNLFVVELEKCLEMAREVGGIEEMRLRRGEGLIKIARSMEPINSKIDFERFEFVSDGDNVQQH